MKPYKQAVEVELQDFELKLQDFEVDLIHDLQVVGETSENEFYKLIFKTNKGD